MTEHHQSAERLMKDFTNLSKEAQSEFISQILEEPLTQQIRARQSAESAARFGLEASGKTAFQEWEEHIGPFLSFEEVQDHLGIKKPQTLTRRIHHNQILSLSKEDGSLLFPSFQFSEKSGKLFPILPQILEAFDEAHISNWAIASWFKSPQELLEDKTPLELIKSHRRNPDIVLAAQRTANHLSH